MAKANTPVEVDPKELENAQAFWAGFTRLITYSCIAIATLLSLMAIFLV